jgi:MFS family permease
MLDNSQEDKEHIKVGDLGLATEEVDIEKESAHTDDEPLDTTKWYNRGLKIFGHQFQPYSYGGIQILMVSFVCFLTVGMYSALGGLGGGGQLNPYAVNNSNVALYATFASMAFFSGSICNVLGVRTLLSVGGWGYALYVGSLISYNINQNSGFVIGAGAILGICAAFLWTAQGTMMMSYVDAANKGKYISLFWMIFQSGNLIGSLIPLGEEINNTSATSVSNGVYAAFFVIIFMGGVLACCVLPAKNVHLKGNKKVLVKKNPTWKSEFIGMYKLLRLEPWLLLLFPYFWASNWFGPYQSNDVNLANFNIRTRALNNVLFCIFEIVGAFVAGFCLDNKWLSRRHTARVGWCVLLCVTMAVWGGSYAYQRGYTRASVKEPSFVAADWTDTSRFIGPMFLYVGYGAFDAMWQTYAYWLMGSLTNSSRKLAIYAGFYKAIQSAGAAVVWRLDSVETPYMTMMALNWGLLGGALVVALPVILYKVRDSTDAEDDIHFTEDI